MPNDFNTPIIEEFRANEGRVGGWFEGARLLLLTTTGRKSGRPHTVPLGYLPDGGERVLVIASAAGAHHHPAWYHNLLAEPEVTVEDGAFTYAATATVLSGSERDRLFARAAESDPGWADYQAKTTRVLPVVALTAVPGPPRPNASSMGGALKLIHDAFRRELQVIRDEVARSGSVLGAQLRVNCLTVCQGLQHHHTMEDRAMFPGVQRPGLEPVLDRLRAEHDQIAVLLAQLQEVLGDPGLGKDALAARVGELTAALDRHLDYEEQEIIPLIG
ncbi:nitroreductase/quinone reductase family protein [Actinoplanes sp. NPDC051859]|uniref:nitroreductase/quinone reductase family protein n=1 Tax=Actinoplanes sp. NPDC051859 TaxID=3363909 RepID=UPI0037A6C51D